MDVKRFEWTPGGMKAMFDGSYVGISSVITMEHGHRNQVDSLVAALRQARQALADYLPAHTNDVTRDAIANADYEIAKATGKA